MSRLNNCWPKAAPRSPLPDGSMRYDCEYHRQGVAQFYMLHEPLAGRRRVQGENRPDRLTFARVVAWLLDEDYAQAERLTLVLDNLSAHQPAAFYEVFDPVRAHALLQRVEFVLIPKHGLWLNIAEIEFAALLPHGLPQRVPERPTLEAHYHALYDCTAFPGCLSTKGSQERKRGH